MAGKGGNDRGRREREHARVPDVIARREICAGGEEGWLLDEPARPKRRRLGSVCTLQQLAAFDATEARFGVRWRDPERHERALRGGRRCPCNSGGERGCRAD